jgi:MFS family permease
MTLASNESLRVLRTPTVRRLVGSDFASLFGDAMVLAAMPFAVLSIGGNAGDVGLVLAAQGLGLVLFLPLGGVGGDKLDRLRVMVSCDLARFFTQAIVAVLLLSGTATVWELLIAQVFHGVATAFFAPASSAVVPDVVAAEAIQPTNGLKAVGYGIAYAAGPAIGAVGVAAGGPGIAMAADAASFLISALLLFGIATLPREVAAAEGAKGFLSAAKDAVSFLQEGWQLFRARTWLWSVTAEFLIVNALVMCPFFVLGPVVMEQSYSGAGSWAALLVALAVGRTIGGIVGINWRPEFPLLGAISVFVVWGAPVILLAFEAPLPIIAIAALLGGITDSVFDVLWNTTIQTQVPSAERARLTSFEESASLASVPLGFAAGGLMEELIGAQAALIGGAVLLVVATISVLLVPSVRRLRAAEPATSPRQEPEIEPEARLG